MVEESFQLENIKYFIINTLITDLIIILKNKPVSNISRVNAHARSISSVTYKFKSYININNKKVRVNIKNYFHRDINFKRLLTSDKKEILNNITMPFDNNFM